MIHHIYDDVPDALGFTNVIMGEHSEIPRTYLVREYCEGGNRIRSAHSWHLYIDQRERNHASRYQKRVRTCHDRDLIPLFIHDAGAVTNR